MPFFGFGGKFSSWAGYLTPKTTIAENAYASTPIGHQRKNYRR
jgi:hypothetical protein